MSKKTNIAAHKKTAVLDTLTGVCQRKLVRYDDMLWYFSPKTAQAILDEFNTHNRDLPRVAAKRYKGDMDSDRWGVCSNPIKFSCVGAIEPGERTLLDGQTRLTGVATSGKGQWFPVIYDVPVESQKVDDRVQQRQFRETVVLFSGVSKKLANIVEKAARRMLYGCVSRPSASHAELEVFMDRHKEALDFVTKVFPKYQVNCTTAPVLGAFARAWYYIDDKDMLVRFADIMKTGENITNQERAAKKLREWMISGTYKGGGTQSIRAFLMTEAAIYYFIRKQTGRCKILFPMPDGDVFPLPEVDPGTGIENGATNKDVAWYRNQFSGKK